MVKMQLKDFGCNHFRNFENESQEFEFRTSLWQKCEKYVKNCIKSGQDITSIDGSKTLVRVKYFRNSEIEILHTDFDENKIKSRIIDHHDINKPYPKSNEIINPKKCSYAGRT